MPKPKMTNERFNELLNGPLAHPLPMFTITRLALALRAVVEGTVDGAKILEAHCADRERQDRENSYCHEHGEPSPCRYCMPSWPEGDFSDDPT